MKYIGKWTPYELIYLIGFSLIIFWVALSFADPEKPDWFNWINVISAISGMACVILVAKGNILNYPIGIINVLLYGYIAYVYHWNGSMFLNWFVFFPLSIVGWFIWNKKLDNTDTVEMKRIPITNMGWVVLAVTGGILIDMMILRNLPTYVSFINAQNIPLLDSISTNFSIVAMILMVYRYAEQWLLWIVIDVVTIIMWVYSYAVDGSGALPVLVMWIAFLVNAIYGYLVWIDYKVDPMMIAFIRGD